MKFLLLNTNQIVQKLVEITARKAGANLTSVREYSQVDDINQYDYIIVDNDCIERSLLKAIKTKRKCLIYDKKGERIDGFNDYIQKPFLPTSILDVFNEQIEHELAERKVNGEDTIGEQMDAALAINEDSSTISLDNLDEGLEGVDSLLSGDSEIEELESNIKETAEAPKADTKEESIAKEAPSESSAPSEVTDSTQEQDTQKLDSKPESEEPIEESILDKDLDLDLSALDNLDIPQDEEAKIDNATENKGNDKDESKEEQGVDTASDVLDEVDSVANEAQNEENIQTDDLVDSALEQDIAESASKQSVADDEEKEIKQEQEVIPSETLESIDDMGNVDDLGIEDINLDDISPHDAEITSNDDETKSDESTESSDNDGKDDSLGLSNDGLLENDLLDEVQSIDIDDTANDIKEPVLDSEQVLEVTDALNALENSAESTKELDSNTEDIGLESEVADEELPIQEQLTDSKESAEAPIDESDNSDEDLDFTTLKEPDVAHALGEEIDEVLEPDIKEPQPSVEVAQTTQPADDINASDMLKDMITDSIQTSITSLSTSSLKSALDGLEVTINISFKDKNK